MNSALTKKRLRVTREERERGRERERERERERMKRACLVFLAENVKCANMFASTRPPQWVGENPGNYAGAKIEFLGPKEVLLKEKTNSAELFIK